MRVMWVSAGVAAVCAMAAPATAGWQYTKWGMTPEEVSAASNGSAPESLGTSGDAIEGLEIGNVGTYRADVQVFQAIYYYRAGGLARVKLKTTQGCDGLINRLRAAYGQPDFDNRSPVVRQVTWSDRDMGNRVHYTGVGDCSIDYEPLESRGGL
jgi:hypothetical protein